MYRLTADCETAARYLGLIAVVNRMRLSWNTRPLHRTTRFLMLRSLDRRGDVTSSQRRRGLCAPRIASHASAAARSCRPMPLMVRSSSRRRPRSNMQHERRRCSPPPPPQHVVGVVEVAREGAQPGSPRTGAASLSQSPLPAPPAHPTLARSRSRAAHARGWASTNASHRHLASAKPAPTRPYGSQSPGSTRANLPPAARVSAFHLNHGAVLHERPCLPLAMTVARLVSRASPARTWRSGIARGNCARARIPYAGAAGATRRMAHFGTAQGSAEPVPSSRRFCCRAGPAQEGHFAPASVDASSLADRPATMSLRCEK